MCKNGNRFWSDLHLTPVDVDQSVPHYWVALLHHATEAKSLNLQLEHLISTVEQAEDIICIFDQKSCIELINQSFTKQFKNDDWQLNNVTNWYGGADLQWTEQRVRDALNDHVQWSGRNQWIHTQDLPFEAMSNISVVEGDNGEHIFIAVIRDMTEEIELGNKLAHAQKMEAIETFSSADKHDFINMLTAKMGDLLLLKKNRPATKNEVCRIESIEEQSYRAADLIRQMLTFARKQRMDIQNIDLQLQAKEAMKGGTLNGLIRSIKESVH